MNSIKKALEAAKAKGIQHPKIRVDNFVFTLAPATGRNFGSVYVKDKATGAYVGKITNGSFDAAYGFRNYEVIKKVNDINDNLSASIVAHGQKTGYCSCCGRPLVEAVSVASGIGPICAENFGLEELRQQLAIENGCMKNVDWSKNDF